MLEGGLNEDGTPAADTFTAFAFADAVICDRYDWDKHTFED